MANDLIAVIEVSDNLTEILEKYLSDSYRTNKDGSEITKDACKLKSVIVKWMDDSFSDIKIK